MSPAKRKEKGHYISLWVGTLLSQINALSNLLGMYKEKDSQQSCKQMTAG